MSHFWHLQSLYIAKQVCRHFFVASSQVLYMEEDGIMAYFEPRGDFESETGALTQKHLFENLPYLSQSQVG